CVLVHASAEGTDCEWVHIHTYILGTVPAADVRGRPHPGTGEINYSNLFRKLAELRYSRYVAMEFDPLGDAVKGLRDARELAISSARSARAARSFASGRKYESA